MAPSNRDRAREYERRRYEKWQAKQAVKAEHRRVVRRNFTVSAVAVLVVLGLAGGAMLLVRNTDDAELASASASASASAATTGDATAAADATTVASDCPTPTVTPSTTMSFDAAPDASLADDASWTFTMTTSCGDIVATLDGAAAPQAVANTVFLSQQGFWDGSPCHRVTTDGLYVLQCGDPTGTGSGGPGYSFGPVENAPADGVYPAGTLAMARGTSEDSNGSQFFIVYKDTELSGDYTVFGTVTSGLDIVKEIAAAGVADGSTDGTPNAAISIVSTSVVEQ